MKHIKKILFTAFSVFLLFGTIMPVSAQESEATAKIAPTFTCGLSYLVSSNGWKYGFRATMIEDGTTGASKRIYGTYTLKNANNGKTYSYEFDTGMKNGAINYTNTNNRGYTFTKVIAHYYGGGSIVANKII